jgi:hypothetical protein
MVFTYRDAEHSTSQLHFTTFWLSMLAALAATLVAGVRLATTNRSRLGLLVAFGLFTYLPKFMMSINGPVYFDEFGQWRHVNDVLRTGNLMAQNTYQPILRYYPGLAALTDFVHEVTRLPTWHSGQLVVLASHCASLVVIFLLAQEVGLSGKGAFVAAALFGLNPSFMFFDTEFAYESVGITLALLAFFCALRARRAGSARSSWRWATLGACDAACCIATHHVSTAVMLVMVAIVAAFVLPRSAAATKDRRAAALSTWVLFATAAASTAVWVGVIAQPTFAYLSPHLTLAFDQLRTLFGLGGSGSSPAGVLHVPFSGSGASSPGTTEPVYERVAAYAAPVVALALVVPAALGLRKLGRERARTMSPFFILAGAYFVSLPFALTAAGGEAAHRSWSFTYIGLSVVGAFGIQQLAHMRARWRQRPRLLSATVGCVAIAALLVGNVAAGESVLYRFPGPYVFGSDTRSATPEIMSIARWANGHLPAGSKVLSDRASNEILTGYTDLLTATPSDVLCYWIYITGDDMWPALRQLIAKEGFGYFLLDTRIETQTPAISFFPGYVGLASISPKALAAMGNGPYTTLLYRTAHYEFFALHLGAGDGLGSTKAGTRA